MVWCKGQMTKEQKGNKGLMMFRERKQIMILVAAGVMVGGFVLLRYLPLRKEKKAAMQAKAAQAFVLNKASLESTQLSTIKEQLVDIQKTAAKFEANVPVGRNLGGFLHEIANLMNELELSEQQVQPGEETKTDNLNCIPVSIKCKGRLGQIFEFYKRVQTMDRLIRIEQITLKNDNNFSGEVNMQTKGVIYYRTRAEQG